ncbi:MAG TPA: TlpA disulfide reductase family protein [Anaerohalosphaeraceae bacterium]|nr:TlpA disulfide reductase family protein [Anaerohalosphaeraceae bacterium]HOL30638.1 TlpA disulfide reductase family protein [Anaerohalosphaeraceae bacterium]HOM75302.1 TlpA disulfide reductase family protein [Anaerohalosphaeraceae bacterium]HPC63098.1 TlpA disulfide reductase family protein [Anaerohalosphaeraceae bacterium]HPO69932.1 TlpA disulfide reductase family protein [Anaerohalosphaeraceae bacterium]
MNTKRLFIEVLLASFIFFACLPAQAANGSDDVLLNTLPDNCLFCLRVNAFSTTLSKLDMYLAGTSPIPMSIAMLANMQLIGITGDPMLGGIDQNGDFAVFGLLNPDAAAGVPVIGGVLIPVTNYADFVKNNPNCKAGDSGVTVLSAPNSQIGSLMLTEAAGGKYALAVMEGQRDTLGTLKTALSAPAKPLAARLRPAHSQTAAAAPAWGYINLSLLYNTYQPMVLNMLQQAQSQIPAASEEMAGMTAFVLKMYAELFKEFAKDADYAAVTLTPEPALLCIDTALQTKDGSQLAGILTASPQPAKGFTMAGYLDDASAINGLAKLNLASVQKMYDKIFDILAAASEQTAMKDQMETMKAMLKKSIAAMGEEVAFSFSYAGSKPPVKLREIVAVRDSAAMKELMSENVACANLIYQAMGFPAVFKYQPNVSTYKGISIDAASIEMKLPQDPNNPMNAAIEQMYGDAFAYHMALTPDKFLMTMGTDSQETLQKMLDQPAAAAPAGDFKMAWEMLQNTPYSECVCSINIIKLLTGLGEMMQSVEPAASTPIPDIFGGLKGMQTQSCLALGGFSADGQLAIRAAFPKQHLTEIISAVMKMQQKGIEAQQAAIKPGVQTAAPAVPEAPASQKRPAADDASETAAILKSWIGKPAPELRMVDLEGKIYRVSRLKGKKVLLDFWATWCPPCKESIPFLVELRGKTSDADLVIFGLSDEPTDRLNQFVKDFKINYPIISYGDNLPAPYSQITALPTVFVIDTKGIIRDIIVGFEKPQDILTALNKIS